jgi:hypothetical protein
VRLPESTEGSRGSPQIVDACFVFVIERSVVVFSDLLKGKRIFLDAGIAMSPGTQPVHELPSG